MIFREIRDYSQPANLQKKQCGGVFFDDMALHIECRFNKTRSSSVTF